MKQDETNLVPKSSNIFSCDNCYYSTCRKSQFDRHLLTSKHVNTTKMKQMKQNTSIKFECPCGKIFGSRTTLWRHKKMCINTDDITDKDLIVMLLHLCTFKTPIIDVKK